MALTATFLYWVIVTIWGCVLACIVSYSRRVRPVFGSARLLLAVVAIDTLRNLIENVYFGLYFGSHYGFLSPALGAVLGQPLWLMLPKILNVVAGLTVLFVLLRRWFPQAAREHADLEVLATVDGLTGLFNRRHFLVRAAGEYERATRYNRPLAMLMLDLDHFNPTASFNSLANVLVRKSAVTARSWLT